MMERYGQNQKPLHLDEKELKVNLGEGNFIFVCSGCDLFHPEVPPSWIFQILVHTKSFKNEYLFHTKRPSRAVYGIGERHFPVNSTLCVTLESNRPWPGISKAPQPSCRVEALREWEGKKMITIEPIMEFDVMTFSEMILSCNPAQVNIGADSGNNHLPEPSPEKIATLIGELRKFTDVHLKKNLRRLYKEEA
jgi:hypothetical protein